MRQSEKAWIALAAGVTAYEVLCDDGETLSECLDPLYEHPIKKALIIGVIGTTALHLTNMIPEKQDPFHYATLLKKKLRNYRKSTLDDTSDTS